MPDRRTYQDDLKDGLVFWAANEAALREEYAGKTRWLAIYTCIVVGTGEHADQINFVLKTKPRFRLAGIDIRSIVWIDLHPEQTTREKPKLTKSAEERQEKQARKRRKSSRRSTEDDHADPIR